MFINFHSVEINMDLLILNNRYSNIANVQNLSQLFMVIIYILFARNCRCLGVLSFWEYIEVVHS